MLNNKHNDIVSIVLFAVADQIPYKFVEFIDIAIENGQS